MSDNEIFLVLTLIGDDRPGLVGQLSAVIGAHQGNWLECSMAQLAGKFAGILKVSVPESRASRLRAALSELSHLKVITETTSGTSEPKSGRRLKLSLVGHDRIGIVREVTQVLAHHAVNVEQLNTYADSAPMSAEPLFHANADLFATTELDVRALKAELEQLSNDLMVDIALDEAVGI
jgi:glycine cleavage system regulatory protein